MRNITWKISELNEKLDMSATLVEPRENAFMAFEWRHNDASTDITTTLAHFGKVYVTHTHAHTHALAHTHTHTHLSLIHI